MTDDPMITPSSIDELRQQFEAEVATVKDSAAVEQLRVAYVGRKSGKLTDILHGMGSLSNDERRTIGPLANGLRQEIEAKLAELERKFSTSGEQEVDTTLPGVRYPTGHLHLVTQAIDEITRIFERIGFYRVRYPEVEWDWYAFESLNMPPNHPARDEWETFFIDTAPVGKLGQPRTRGLWPSVQGKRILTPHTSSGQVREMQRRKPPIRMMNISKCYRRQSDASHVPMFHQFEGLLIDENVTIGDLTGTWEYFVHAFFGPERKVRIRPFHFQFTEPSVELDVSCGVCNGKGCKLCKDGWLELGGGGMVHPNVLKAGKLDPKKYSSFAFGWGVERCALMKSGLAIPDIRMLYQNDIRFLRQF